MMSQNSFLDDLARVASGAAGALAGARTEMEQLFRQRLERYLAEADMVPRDEFQAIKDVAINAREAQEILEERVAKLEAEVVALKKLTPRTPSKNTNKSSGD
ncbi:MAG: accessory factor UbiK family protein [Pseudomonadota bacterium]|nr:accessory factor UbiK family protein [Pseudomonadota bacterium]